MTLGRDWVLNHVGMTVGNRNAVLQHYQSLGIGVSVGPQPLLPHEDGEGSLMFYRTLDGDPVTNTYRTGGAHNFKDGECQIGDCQLECFPMRPGPGIFLSEYLEKKGAGINHICFNSATVEEDTQILVGRGCDIMFNATVNGRTVENYLDSRKYGDLMISLRPSASAWEKAWKANNESHPLVNSWRFMGVGIAVSDVAEAVDFYHALGFDAIDNLTTNAELGVYRQSVQVGPLVFEFCQPVGETSYCWEPLMNRGQGVFDLMFEVNDLSGETRHLESRGLGAAFGTRDVACFDVRAEGNTYLRLFANDISNDKDKLTASA
ncbi:MAG: VOC family protein [Pseudomonadota bacterium]